MLTKLNELANVLDDVQNYLKDHAAPVSLYSTLYNARCRLQEVIEDLEENCGDTVASSLERCAFLLRRIHNGDHQALEVASEASAEAVERLVAAGVELDPEEWGEVLSEAGDEEAE
jgi:hypothetical protein